MEGRRIEDFDLGYKITYEEDGTFALWQKKMLTEEYNLVCDRFESRNKAIDCLIEILRREKI